MCSISPTPPPADVALMFRTRPLPIASRLLAAWTRLFRRRTDERGEALRGDGCHLDVARFRHFHLLAQKCRRPHRFPAASLEQAPVEWPSSTGTRGQLRSSVVPI